VSQGAARSTSVDFLRGLSLIVIALDHIPQSALAHLTLHAYAYFDAAEVFVFLGGYASAAAYCAMTAGGVAAQAQLPLSSKRVGRSACASAIRNWGQKFKGLDESNCWNQRPASLILLIE
jgi:hypothetical protein